MLLFYYYYSSVEFYQDDPLIICVIWLHFLSLTFSIASFFVLFHLGHLSKLEIAVSGDADMFLNANFVRVFNLDMWLGLF